MGNAWAKVPVDVGDEIFMGGTTYKVKEKVSADEYLLVEHTLEKEHTKHVDWIYEEAANSSVVIINKEE